MKKEEKATKPSIKQEQTSQSSDNSLATVSIVLGIVSLTGPGLILGIPAIITGAIALKKKQGERGLSIAGVVTGIVSTVISVLLLGLFAFLIILGLNNPETLKEMEQKQPPRHELQFERSQT